MSSGFLQQVEQRSKIFSMISIIRKSQKLNEPAINRKHQETLTAMKSQFSGVYIQVHIFKHQFFS